MGCGASPSETGIRVTMGKGVGRISRSVLASRGPHSHLLTDQLAYSCFSHLMKRMSQNFPNGGAMDTHFANMRSLIQVSDAAA